jgi:glycosyltransferase involved in cell wall biosynthesis
VSAPEAPPVRVLHLAALDDAPGAGMERVIRDLAGFRGPRRSTHQIFRLAPDRGRLDLGWIPAFVAAARAADVVHTHDLFGWALGPAVLRAAGRPVVAHDHGAAGRAGALRRRLARAVERRIARHVAVSEFARRALVEGHGIAPERVEVVPNGRDPAELASARPRAEVRRALGVAPEDVLVLAVARLAPEKGLEPLLDGFAAAAAAPGAPPLALAIAGDGPLREPLAARARGRVRLLGFRPDVPDLLAAADVFALTSRAEAFGLALVEAAFAGLAAIGARAGGIPEIVAPEETGLLVPPDDAPAVAAAIARLARDPALRARFGAAARARAEGRFTLARAVARFDEIYARARETG